jgi:hypothetical protein
MESSTTTHNQVGPEQLRRTGPEHAPAGPDHLGQMGPELAAEITRRIPRARRKRSWTGCSAGWPPFAAGVGGAWRRPPRSWPPPLPRGGRLRRCSPPRSRTGPRRARGPRRPTGSTRRQGPARPCDIRRSPGGPRWRPASAASGPGPLPDLGYHRHRPASSRWRLDRHAQRPARVVHRIRAVPGGQPGQLRHYRAPQGPVTIPLRPGTQPTPANAASVPASIPVTG